MATEDAVIITPGSLQQQSTVSMKKVIACEWNIYD